MTKISDETLRLMKARDRADQMFLEQMVEAPTLNHLQQIANLALIGGRLDTIIRRKLAAEHKPRAGWHQSRNERGDDI